MSNVDWCYECMVTFVPKADVRLEDVCRLYPVMLSGEALQLIGHADPWDDNIREVLVSFADQDKPILYLYHHWGHIASDDDDAILAGEAKLADFVSDDFQPTTWQEAAKKNEVAQGEFRRIPETPLQIPF